MVVEHEAVILPQKFTAQPRKEEVAEGFLVNGYDAGKIIRRGFADYIG
jgi:hypothetical protein